LKKKVIIIGAGVGGLATAIRLSHAGFTVDIFESNEYPGGKLSDFVQGNYRFDAGPSLFTLPHLVQELLLLAKISAQDFPVIKLEKGCHYFYDDGIRLNAYHDQKLFGEELQKKLGVDPQIVFDYLSSAQKKYESTAPLFLESSLHLPKTYFSKKTLKGILAMPSLNLFETMNQQNVRDLKNPHLVQFFNRFATYNGSNPFVAPAILNMIPHLEHGIGTFFPKHGMIQITNSLMAAAEKLGVNFHFNKKVNAIKVESGRVKGIGVDEKIILADLVVSNMDVHPTYRKLLSDQKAPEGLLAQEKSSSAIIFYWGIKHQFSEMDLHNIFFSSNYEEEFDYIFKRKELYNDPTIYVNISSKYLPSDAPANCENWFVMINVPGNIGQDWDDYIARARVNILAKLSRLLKQSIEPLIENESVLDPRLIESKTSSFGGALYGNASNNRYAAFLRHANFSSKIKGLYFCGGSVHPGGGIPLCLSSGKIVSEIILEREA
jgi:phytoene desaturase